MLVMIMFGMIDLERIYQKRQILTLADIFAYNSKWVLPQRASFSHAGTHLSRPFTEKVEKTWAFPSRWRIIDNTNNLYTMIWSFMKPTIVIEKKTKWLFFPHMTKKQKNKKQKKCLVTRLTLPHDHNSGSIACRNPKVLEAMYQSRKTKTKNQKQKQNKQSKQTNKPKYAQH